MFSLYTTGVYRFLIDKHILQQVFKPWKININNSYILLIKKLISLIHRITESAELQGTHQGSSSPAVGPTQDSPRAHHVPESTVQTHNEFCQAGTVPTSLGACSSAQQTCG